MFRLTAMSSRRALLTGGLASLLPFTVRAQSPSRARELLGPLLSAASRAGRQRGADPGWRDRRACRHRRRPADTLPGSLDQQGGDGRHRAAPGRTGSPRPRYASERDAALVGTARRRSAIRHAAPAAQPSRRHHGARASRAMPSASRCRRCCKFSTAHRPPTRQRCGSRGRRERRSATPAAAPWCCSAW